MSKEINYEEILQDLSPIEEVSNNEIYNDALNYGIKKESVKNIALSGAYGSGKSSILKTFEKSYKYNFLNISLADFFKYCC